MFVHSFIYPSTHIHLLVNIALSLSLSLSLTDTRSTIEVDLPVPMLAAYTGCLLVKKSAHITYKRLGRLMLASDMIDYEAFVERLTRPTSQLKTPSIDFFKPHLVQITITDVGACTPLISLVWEL